MNSKMWKYVPLVVLCVAVISAVIAVFVRNQSGLMYSMIIIMVSAIGTLIIAAPPNDDEEVQDGPEDDSEDEVKAPEQDVSILRKVFERDAFAVSVMLAFITIFSSLALTRHNFLASGIILSVGTVLVIGKIIFGVVFFKKEARKNEPAENSGEEIVASEQKVSSLRKRIESNGPDIMVVLFFAVFLGMLTSLNYGPWAGAMIGFIVLVVLAGLIFFEFVVEEPKNGTSADPSKEIIAPKQNDAALEYLVTAYQAAPEHCLAPYIDSIVKRATRLLAYRKEDGVVGEILQTYHAFIDQYVVRAAELVRKYWKAHEYLNAVDYAGLSAEISSLQTEIEGGDVSAQKTLQEKMTTKAGLDAMQKKQVFIKRGLGEIAATLEAMETTVVSAEMSDADAKDVRDELQRTLSSTTQAIKETLCD